MTNPAKKSRAFYTAPSLMTSAGKYQGQMKNLPDDIGELARIVQGLIVHQFVAEPFYCASFSDERRQESHIRAAEDMMDALLSVDNRALKVARPPAKRFAGICRNFALLLVAILRAKGIPARSRYGFAACFNPPLNVPRNQFLIAGDAWTQCRSGKADSSKFGTFNGNLYGLWFIAGSLIRDVAALNKMEMLQWDVWGAQPQPGEQLNDAQAAFFDNLAEMTRQPDESFDKLRKLYEKDDRVRVPPTVFNALLNRPETVR